MKEINCPQCNEPITLLRDWPEEHRIKGRARVQQVTGAICGNCDYIEYGTLQGQYFVTDPKPAA